MKLAINSALLRFYLGIVLLVLLLFFSLNQLYSWVYQRDDLAEAAQSMLLHVHHYDGHLQAANGQVDTEPKRLSCRISDSEDCENALFVTYPAGFWQPQPGFIYAIEVMRDSHGNASMCSEMAGGELLCLSQLNLPDGTDFSIDLAHVFILLLLLFMFWLSRNLFRDVETLRKNALQEIKLGRLPAFELSRQSYLAPLAQSLSGMNETIEDLNRLPREMADTVCHDIKTPLARLRFILLSLERQLSAEQAGQVSRNLQEIEDNVYDYLRLAQQDFRADLKLDLVDLRALLQDLIDKFAANSDHQLVLESGEPVVIQADEKLLRRAISNLLSNALRYCHSKVWVRVVHSQSDCLIDVCDDGPGWQPLTARGESTDCAVTNFLQTTAAKAHPNSQGGDGMPHHGIGLAIVARVAHQHGGRLHRLANPNQGAIARLQLPLGVNPDASTTSNTETGMGAVIGRLTD